VGLCEEGPLYRRAPPALRRAPTSVSGRCAPAGLPEGEGGGEGERNLARSPVGASDTAAAFTEGVAHTRTETRWGAATALRMETRCWAAPLIGAEACMEVCMALERGKWEEGRSCCGAPKCDEKTRLRIRPSGGGGVCRSAYRKSY
jgi:hypothetical protein